MSCAFCIATTNAAGQPAYIFQDDQFRDGGPFYWDIQVQGAISPAQSTPITAELLDTVTSPSTIVESQTVPAGETNIVYLALGQQPPIPTNSSGWAELQWVLYNGSTQIATSDLMPATADAINIELVGPPPALYGDPAVVDVTQSVALPMSMNFVIGFTASVSNGSNGDPAMTLPPGSQCSYGVDGVVGFIMPSGTTSCDVILGNPLPYGQGGFTSIVLAGAMVTNPSVTEIPIIVGYPTILIPWPQLTVSGTLPSGRTITNGEGNGYLAAPAIPVTIGNAVPGQIIDLYQSTVSQSLNSGVSIASCTVGSNDTCSTTITPPSGMGSWYYAAGAPGSGNFVINWQSNVFAIDWWDCELSFSSATDTFTVSWGIPALVGYRMVLIYDNSQVAGVCVMGSSGTCSIPYTNLTTGAPATPSPGEYNIDLLPNSPNSVGTVISNTVTVS
jgi:hypothetical protein